MGHIIYSHPFNQSPSINLITINYNHTVVHNRLQSHKMCFISNREGGFVLGQSMARTLVADFA